MVAMGAMRVDGVFQATTIEFPTTEPRDALPMAAQVRGQAGPRALRAGGLKRLWCQGLKENDAHGNTGNHDWFFQLESRGMPCP